MRKQRIFITGGAGFIGANMVKYLLDRGGCDITVYDNLSACAKGNLYRAERDSKRKGSLAFVRGDIFDLPKLSKAMRGHTAVVHLAAHTKVLESLKNPQENFSVNSIGTFNALEAARINKIRKFIFASSNAAVGEQKPPINEKMVPKPLSPYGATKLFGEGLCSAYFHSYDLKTVSLRFANAYGPYSGHKTSVVAKFLKRVKAGKPLGIYGDGKQSRDFIHAGDICQAIHLILNPYRFNSKIWGEVFQVATGIETKIIDLAKAMRGLARGREADIVFTSARKGEIRKNFSDIAKAKRVLGFRPQIRLEEGLKEIWRKEREACRI